MRWRTVETKRRRLQELGWHQWFAWRPVRVNEDSQWVWLETVMRKCGWGSYGYSLHQYLTLDEYQQHPKPLPIRLKEAARRMKAPPPPDPSENPGGYVKW